jgi:glycine betaine/choline ABC-type transport system substrate-binding protein
MGNINLSIRVRSCFIDLKNTINNRFYNVLGGTQFLHLIILAILLFNFSQSAKAKDIVITEQLSTESQILCNGDILPAQTSFTITQTRILSKVKMYINGIRISNTAYSLSGNIVTYVPTNNGAYAISINDRVQFEYTY